MDRERYERIKSLFIEASELAGEERDALLASASSDVRGEVLRMLDSGTLTFLNETPLQPQQSPNAALQPGQRFGRYDIQREIGSGGGGHVYLATDTHLRRHVAIKTLTSDAAGPARRFAREAESASALNHPNIVTVYEAGLENGISYIAMEYIGGQSLRAHIPKKGGGLPLPRVFEWAIQICDALATAHKAGLIHRDLKPGNIMITERGTPKIVDFGLAKPAFERAEDKTITAAGVALGTAGYMAPEQASGGDVDARADIFSLGCLLYEMASGKRAFTGSTQLELLASVINKEPEPLPSFVPPAMARIISLCLRKDPATRLQSAADIKLMLGQLRDAPEESPAALAAPARTSVWKIALATLAGAALTVAAGWYWTSRASASIGPLAVTTMLTTDSGLSSHPALSSDGRLLVYASDRSGEGNLDIWLQQIGGGSPVRLTTGPEDETTPDFSPDSSRIVFRSEKDGGGIYTMPVLGGEPVLLAQGGRNPKYSPDGTQIAYWSGLENQALLPGAASVYTIPPGGGQPRHVSKQMAAAMYPVWSPDGKQLLAVARKLPQLEQEPAGDWWVLDAAETKPPVATGVMTLLGSQKPRLSRPPIWQSQLTPIVWKADGKAVFSARLGDSANLWQIAIDLATRRAIGPPEPVTTGTGYEAEGTLVNTANSDRLGFSALTLHFDLWSIPVDVEKGTAKGEPVPVTSDASYEFYPSVSDDGAKLSYVTSRGNIRSLCLRDTATNRERVLYTGSSIITPRISGDGGSITFVDHNGDVMRISTKGGATQRLCAACGTPTHVDFSGSSVILESNESPESVQLLDAASGKVTTIVPARERLFDAKFSRDGKWLVFHGLRPGSPNAQVFIAPYEAGKQATPDSWIAVTDNESRNQSVSWSPDGEAIYFLSERDGFRCVYSRRVDRTTKQPAGPIVSVRHFHFARRSLQAIRSFDAQTELSITRDKVIVVVGELTGNIWLRERRLPPR